MSLSITEALDQAQQALNGGDFGSAATTCSQLVSQFPGYASAYQVLGEAYREQGLTDEAERAYAAAFVRQPRHAATSLGLGLIAEDRGSNEAALAYCQVAWELAPNQSALREPLTRVSLRRYGSDGELQFTRAALAQLHAIGSRLRRAVGEYRRALAELPDRLDLQVGLLEALWRLGDESEARALAEQIAEQQPACAPALAILADLERRSGNTRRAEELRAQLRSADPDGAIVAQLLLVNPRADHAFLTLAHSEIPAFDDTIAVAQERPRIAPAPDFDYQPTRSEIPTPDMAELSPISLEEFGGMSDTSSVPADDAAFTFDDLGDLPEGLQPISIEELGGLPGETAGPFDDSEGFDFAAFAASTEAEAPAPFTLDDVLKFDEPAAVAPEPVYADAALDAPADAPVDDAQLDDLASLAAALEGDVAEALNRVGEPVDETAMLDESLPPTTPPRGYTTVLRGLEDEGLAPFNPRDREPIEGMPSMLTDEVPTFQPTEDIELAGSARPATDTEAQTDEFGRITREWDSIDDEIQAAMPVEAGRGYTDELRSLDEIGLTPFEIEEDEALEGVTPFNPFASEPIETPPTPFLLNDMEAASQQPVFEGAAEAADLATDELLSGLEPFSFEEFDSGTQGESDQQVGAVFGQPSWDSSTSAIPSDADLDALLASEDDEPMPDLDSEPEPAVEVEAQVDVEVEAETETAPAADQELTADIFDFDKIDPVPLSKQPDPFVAPNLGEQDLADFFESSIAVTRQLPGDESWADFQPTDAAAEAAMPEAVAESDAAAPTDDAPREKSLTSSLRPGTEVFTRARAVKLGLISDGRIGGTRELDAELDAGITTDELIAMEDRFKTRDLPSIDAESFDDDDDDDLITTTGATRDTRTLRAALEVTPDDDELRWWLAEALRDRGDLDDAYTEYRWLIRHAPHRHDQIMDALNDSIERDQSPDVAHRLLGDIYRRRGDVTRASNHATLALRLRRHVGRIS